MRAIHKFPLAPPFIIPMPADAKIIHVGEQDNFPFLWAELDTDGVYVKRNFLVLGTGHPFPKHVTRWEHLGTVKLDDGAIMIHVYEELETNVH